MRFRLIILFIFSTIVLTGSSFLSAQSVTGRKSMEAVRTTESPVIDGQINESVWQKANVADDFIQYSPYGGERSTLNTEVRLLYDDEAIYIAAIMYDTSPDSIFRDLGRRDSDNDLNADFFYVDISTFNDGLNGETFKISASGVQSDMKARSSASMWGHGDRSWDAVWYSSVEINDSGWVAEIKIPFSALRFASDAAQTWGVNFWREIRRSREVSSWNYVDREAGSTFNHLGQITDLTDIIPPVRLSLTPYVSGYMERFNGNRPDYSMSGGMDIKYGINESFTLDATLIPDFGQVQSDDHVLNLSPYEVKYNERRPFFMEGTELFNRGDLFYSRRIGSAPRYSRSVADSLETHEVIANNPQESSLMNATKISGRTKSGLGIGFFNAFTRSMSATLEDTLSLTDRKVVTGPLTNYNMLVLDQTLRNGSFVSLMNTNVMEPWDKNADRYTANVTGAEFKLQNSAKTYSVSARGTISQKYYSDGENSYGHSYDLTAGKTGGRFRGSYTLAALSDTYDPNDMGYLRRNNEFNNSVDISYNTFSPFWIIYTTRNSVTFNYKQLYYPRLFTGSSVSFNSMTMFRNYWMLIIRSEFTPGGEDDFYEPRVPGRYYHRPRELMGYIKFDTDKSKRLYFDFSASITKGYSDLDPIAFSISAEPEVKLSSRATVGVDLSYNRQINDAGYVATDYTNGDIWFGKRDNSTISTTLNGAYIFTADISLTFRLRHYWSRADYNGEYYLLGNDGLLNPAAYSENHDYNYNAFNIDMVYTWRFAPGSELSVVWKNSIYAGADRIYYELGENLTHLFDSDKMNSISLKVLYYLDYQNLKKRF
ncbi:MAG: carbohydrate binding family 9 domain-containing protein [Bacteroidales bacterium]|nr:carbohydrate binding family 9 domain-containing protein [Bacteroidales bacterium]